MILMLPEISFYLFKIGFDFQGDQTGGDVEEELRIDSRSPRGDKPIFECFWNGRLIPYTTID